MTTGQLLQSPQSTEPVRIGPFELLSDRQPWGIDGAWEAPVRGADGTPLQGIKGIATGATASGDSEARQRLQARVGQIAKFKHASMTPILAAGVRGDEALIVYANDGSSPLAMAAQPPASVGVIVSQVAGALAVAHQAGIGHGGVGFRSVQRGSGGEVRPGRWEFGDADPHQDQFDLAAFTVVLLLGRSVDLPSGQGAQRAQILRNHLENIAERVVFVLARGLAQSPDDRFPSITDFAEAFTSSIGFAAEDLVASAWESASSGSRELAQFFADAATRYNPDVNGLGSLRVRLGAGQPGMVGMSTPMQWPAQPMTSPQAMPAATAPFLQPSFDGPIIGVPMMPPPGMPAADQPTGMPATASAPAVPLAPQTSGPVWGAPPTSTPAVMTGLDPALTAGVPPELLATIAPQLPTTAAKKRLGGIWIIILGMFVLMLFMAAAAFLTIALGG